MGIYFNPSIFGMAKTEAGTTRTVVDRLRCPEEGLGVAVALAKRL